MQAFADKLIQTWFEADQAFVHVRPLDAMDHLGEALPYSTAVYLFAD